MIVVEGAAWTFANPHAHRRGTTVQFDAASKHVIGDNAAFRFRLARRLL
jgi:hypothetical protein